MDVLGPREIALRPGERVAARLLANHIRDGLADDGYLFVTSQRLIHRPWPAAVARGAHAFAIDLAEVTSVDEATGGTRHGSWRRKLRVTTVSGDAELFVVWRVGKSIELVERMREAALAG